MSIQEAKDKICDMVSMVQEIVSEEDFEKYDNAGVMAIEALEKQVPKKMDVWANGKEYCPRCEQDMSCLGFKVCISCGQALDW